MYTFTTPAAKFSYDTASAGPQEAVTGNRRGQDTLQEGGSSEKAALQRSKQNVIHIITDLHKLTHTLAASSQLFWHDANVN